MGVLSELGKLQTKLQWEEVELTTKHEMILQAMRSPPTIEQCWDEARFCMWRVGLQCCLSDIRCGPPMNLQWLQLTRTNLVPRLET
ncbi:hypothetical protein CY35_01G142800 [Sphagnum magellanicum]|nr:hypothetical protein CY35_01G142800 [Sphagnum magellanicum]